MCILVILLYIYTCISHIFLKKYTLKQYITESPKEMPYFSQPDLVNKYGYTEKIRYMYYLKQGRPSFAFVSFLAEAYDMEPTGITQQR